MTAKMTPSPTECQKVGCRETHTEKRIVNERGGYKLFCSDHFGDSHPFEMCEPGSDCGLCWPKAAVR